MEICKIAFFCLYQNFEFLKSPPFFHGLQSSVWFSNSYSRVCKKVAFCWWVADVDSLFLSPLIKENKTVVRVGPPQTKLSGSAHVAVHVS